MPAGMGHPAHCLERQCAGCGQWDDHLHHFILDGSGNTEQGTASAQILVTANSLTAGTSYMA